jgi:hypothetical protein
MQLRDTKWTDDKRIQRQWEIHMTESHITHQSGDPLHYVVLGQLDMFSRTFEAQIMTRLGTCPFSREDDGVVDNLAFYGLGEGDGLNGL